MTTLITYPIYDLSNPHFQTTEVVTKTGDILKGQFVQFKVVKGFVEYLYPSEKYCFLPKENSKDFWKISDGSNGEFKEFPAYIKLLGLNDIQKITIHPQLVI